MTSPEPAPSKRGLRPWLAWILLPLLVGLGLAALVPRPIVGLIYLQDAIYGFTAREMIAQIHYARDHSQVRAVVLVLDSPGGTVVDTEAVYLELAKLRERKPVVTMAQGVAASGAYYLSVGTDYIFAGPSALVGNVGVISQLPTAPMVFEDLASTGPYKLFGSARDARLREMESIKQAFYSAVQLGRGEALAIGSERILRGEIWLGNEAARFGLIDELGSISAAIEKAADLSHVANYRVADLRDLAGLPLSFGVPFFFKTPEGVLTPYPNAPGFYLLYVPPGERSLP